jgi:CheY-like chemotaxis protein
MHVSADLHIQGKNMSGTAKKRVLVIDDEDGPVLTVKRLLPRDRYEIAWAKTRFEAFDQIERRAPDLIVLDLRLSDRAGDKSGLALLKELRTQWPGIQVIVFTAYYLEPDMIVECMRSGAYYYYIKGGFSTEPSRFVDLVNEAVAYRPTHDVLEDSYPHPLALLYRDYRRNVVVPQLKFRRLIELAEFLVKLASVVCLSALGGDHRGFASGRMASNSLLRPSLGTWFEFLRYAINRPSPAPWIDEIRQIFSASRRSTVDSFVRIRNEWIGHGVTRPDHEYKQIIDKWNDPLMELLNAASIFSVWQFFVVRSTRLLSGERYLHTVVTLKGHNPKFLVEQVELPVNCEADKVYVWDAPRNALLSLDPFIAVTVCDQCGQESVFVYDKLERNEVLYLDYANGHHTARVEPYRAIKVMLEPRLPGDAR